MKETRREGVRGGIKGESEGEILKSTEVGKVRANEREREAVKMKDKYREGGKLDRGK